MLAWNYSGHRFGNASPALSLQEEAGGGQEGHGQAACLIQELPRCFSSANCCNASSEQAFTPC